MNYQRFFSWHLRPNIICALLVLLHYPSSTSHSLRALLDGLQETNLFKYSFAGNSCSGNPNSCGKHEQLSSHWGNESLQQCSRELPAASLGVISVSSFLISLHHQPFSYHLISFIRFSLLWIPLNYKSF